MNTTLSALTSRFANLVRPVLPVAVVVMLGWTAWGVMTLVTDARETSSFLSSLANSRELEAIADGIPADERASLRAEAAAAQQVEAQIEAAVAQSLTALALLVVTAVYVWLTYQLVAATRAGHDISQATVNEMVAAREQELHVRRQERSEEAALRAIQAIRDSDIRTGRGEPEAVKAACPALHVALEAEVPFIVDQEVVNRIDACQDAVRVFGWPEDQFEGYDHALASIRVRQIVTVTRRTLEAHVAGRALPDWGDLPERPAAMSWIFGPRRDD